MRPRCLYLEVCGTVARQATCELKTCAVYFRPGADLVFSQRLQSYLPINRRQEMRREGAGKICGWLIAWVNVFFFSLSPFSPSFLLSREKYINIILKMEEMLKSWFPNVKLQDQVVVTQTEEAAPTKKLKVKLCKDSR